MPRKKQPSRPARAKTPASVRSYAKARAGFSPKQSAPDGQAILQLMQYPVGTPIYTQGLSNRLNKVRHYKGWVYVAIRAIAEKIAQLRPCIGIKRNSGGKDKYLRKHMRERLKSTTNIHEHEDVEPLENHPLIDLLNDPNEPDTAAELWYRTILFWELCGITYWWLPRNNAGLPAEVWVLPSHWVTPIGGVDRLVEKYRILPLEGAYKAVEIDADDIVAIKHPSPVSIVDGWSAMDGGNAWVDQADAMDSARWFQLQNAHEPGLVLQLDKTMTKPSKEDLDAAYMMIGERLRGPSKNRMPLILPPGWESAGKFGMTSEELDYNGAMEQIRDMVLALFRVPKGVLGIEPGQANTSAYAPNQFFFDQCINPKLHFLGQCLTEKLAKKRYDEKLLIYWNNQAPLDPQLEQQKWQAALNAGGCTYNEYRQNYLGLEAYEDFGDEPLIPSGLVPVPTDDTGVEPILPDAGVQSRPYVQDNPKDEPAKEEEATQEGGEE